MVQTFSLYALVGVANLATRWHEVPLASPGGVAERSEFFKIMIAGGNHTTVKSWQPERADLSARRRYASEQPP